MVSSVETETNTLHWINSIAFLATLCATAKFQGQIKDAKDHPERYRTLIMPAAYAFAIWAVIFVSQATWILLWFLRPQESIFLPKDTIGILFAIACGLQCLWSTFLYHGNITCAMFAIMAQLGTEVVIVHKLGRLPICDIPGKTFWVTKYSMELYTGWILVAGVLTVNLWLVQWGLSKAAQIRAAKVSLVVFGTIGMVACAVSPTISLVLVWTSLAISNEQEAASSKPFEGRRFTDEECRGIQTTAQKLAMLLLAAVSVAILHTKTLGNETVWKVLEPDRYGFTIV